MARKFGDRPDGRRLRDIPPMMQVLTDIKPRRADNLVYINQKVDVTELADYLAKKKEAGDAYTYFHAILALVGKTLYNRPKLNRFISNRHFYEHTEVSFSYIAKVGFDDNSIEIMSVLEVEPGDTIKEIREKISKKIDAVRKSHDDAGDATNDAMNFVGKLPNVLRVPVMGMFKLMAKTGKLPREFTKNNLYYSSMIISNLGAIRCGAIVHNIADFGTASSLLTIGEVKDEEVLQPDGTTAIRKICEFGVSLDERIGDGYYFAKSVHLMQYILSHPEMLEERADTPIPMDEIR